MATKTTKKSASTAKKASSKTKKQSTKSTKAASSRKQRATAVEEPVIRRVKSVSWMAILESLVVGALGVLLLLNGDTIAQVIFYVLGIFLMIKGVYKIVNYFAVHGKYDFYNNDLLYGIIALVFGILAVILWDQFMRLIGIVVGAWLIYGALVRMNTAIKLRTAGVKEWFYVLLLAIVMMALGIYMVISTTAGIVLIGWLMVAAAVVGVINDVIFIRHLDVVSK